jgi:hypothetical protein
LPKPGLVKALVAQFGNGMPFYSPALSLKDGRGKRKIPEFLKSISPFPVILTEKKVGIMSGRNA